ncbi:MAG TPA: hypothetical protein VFB42_03815 [Gaiellaceae bacterium]|nr:hypothetical protein [Gaiellaceae bacterium]
MRRRLAAALLGVAVGAAAVLVATFLVRDALADGDPASDYLISQQVFLPFDAKVSKERAGELTSLLDESKRRGFPLKVAVISSRFDLGAVPSLFGKPERYATFLGQEDYYFFKDELLVVMPQGYGLYKHGGLPPGDRAALAALPAPASAAGDALARAAVRAVRALAARHGVDLPAGGGGGGSAWRDRLLIGAGALLLAVAAVALRAAVRRR